MTPEEVELLSELTIVIPTFNRPLELERAIEYWRDTPVTVHILDGSKKPWFSVGLLPNTNSIRYHHVAQSVGDHPFENYAKRIRLSTELVDTRYSALCSDDDLFAVSGLIYALRSLRDDKSDVVIGKCAQYLLRDEIFEWKTINWDWRNDNLSLSRDIWDHFSSNSKGSTYYGVYLTSEWKKIRLSSVERKFSNASALENISDFLTRRALRVLVLDSYLWISNYPDKSYPDIKFKNILEKFSEWLNNTQNKQEVEVFISVLESGFKKFLPQERQHIAKFMAKSIFIDKNALKRRSLIRRIRASVDQKLLRALSILPFVVRNNLFLLLTKKWKKILRTPDFVDSRTPVEDIDSEDRELSEAIRNWEGILLMPREELRLRANI